MGYYDGGKTAAEADEVRVASIEILERETYRAAGRAEVVISVPSRGYKQAAWELDWYPDPLGDELEIDFKPKGGEAEAPTDEDGTIDDEIFELGYFIVHGTILSHGSRVPASLERSDEGYEALAQAWGIADAIQKGL